MGRLYISEVNQVDGPWLLGHENLETLNTLFKEIDSKLKEALDKTIDNMAKQQMEEDGQNIDLPKRIAKLQRKYNQKSKTAEITFEDGKYYKTDDIGAIINYVDTNESQAPMELEIRTIHGNYENEFNLIINTNAGKEEVDFEYRIRCIDEEIQQKIKSSIDKWIRDNKSHTLLTIWSNWIVYLIWFFGFFTILFSAGNLTYTTSKTESYKLELKKEAQKIIESRISPENADSSLLLLLKLQSDYVPDNIKASTTIVHDKGALKVLIASIVIFFISLVRPKTIIGIGKKCRRLKLYRLWVRLICVTLGLLTSALITDYFVDFIHW